MISVRNLKHQYSEGGFVLSIPTLTIPDGDSVALIGPSGSGKSTLLNLIAGTIACQQGEIEVNEVRVDRLTDSAKRRFRVRDIGFVFQELELIEHLTIRENILLPLLINRSAHAAGDYNAKCETLATQVGLSDKLNRRPKQLSTGEKQRVALCRALVTSPKLILADEPTGSLDPHTTRVILDLLLAQSKETGATLLVVTHDHTQLERFSRVIDISSNPG
ncbi:ABC transporter ATP-binding protein [Pirellulaceae bacterium SH449]